NAADQASCLAVERCMRQTDCIHSGNIKCYCGSFDIGTCRTASTVVDGACAAVIKQAYPSTFANADIVTDIGDVTIPGGCALARGQCDFTQCITQCIGYCGQTE